MVDSSHRLCEYRASSSAPSFCAANNCTCKPLHQHGGRGAGQCLGLARLAGIHHQHCRCIGLALCALPWASSARRCLRTLAPIPQHMPVYAATRPMAAEGDRASKSIPLSCPKSLNPGGALQPPPLLSMRRQHRGNRVLPCKLHALLRPKHRQHRRQSIGVHALFMKHGDAGQVMLHRPARARVQRV